MADNLADFLLRLVMSNGLIGLLGWLSLMVLCVAALWFMFKGRSSARVCVEFHEIAYLQFMVFILTVFIHGIDLGFCCVAGDLYLRLFILNTAEQIISIGIEMVVIVALVTIVTLVTKTRLRIQPWMIFGLWIVATNVVILVGVLMRVMLPILARR